MLSAANNKEIVEVLLEKPTIDISLQEHGILTALGLTTSDEILDLLRSAGKHVR